mmetsp:Transcript_37957/g.103596  ORF Transcript_37957/g.103596 Transcript_37957/m.103596 type:complete len:92 (-) Transcript_37957:88-363(-)
MTTKFINNQGVTLHEYTQAPRCKRGCGTTTTTSSSGGGEVLLVLITAVAAAVSVCLALALWRRLVRREGASKGGGGVKPAPGLYAKLRVAL